MLFCATKPFPLLPSLLASHVSPPRFLPLTPSPLFLLLLIFPFLSSSFSPSYSSFPLPSSSSPPPRPVSLLLPFTSPSPPSPPAPPPTQSTYRWSRLVRLPRVFVPYAQTAVARKPWKGLPPKKDQLSPPSEKIYMSKSSPGSSEY